MNIRAPLRSASAATRRSRSGPQLSCGVRSEPGPNARARGVRSETVEEGLRLAKAGLRIRVVQRVREHRPKAALLDRAGDLAHVAVPIGDRRHAARQELEAARECRGA